jgi:mRNA interferase RelE/StbE
VTTYRVELARRAVRSLASLPRREQQRVRAAIDLLATEPRPPAASKLAGERHAYRVRVGVYRILYEIFDDRLLVQVVRIGHRRDVYKH